MTPQGFLRSIPDALAEHSLRVPVAYVPEIGAIATTFQPVFETAGSIDRRKREILIASKFKREQQRFTLAHELGHWILHSGLVYHRDRPLGDTPVNASRPVVEMEADFFAAELLMPRRYVRACFIQRFQSAATFVDDEDGMQILADAINSRSGLADEMRVRECVSADNLTTSTPLERARAVAQVSGFGHRRFEPLTTHFAVSSTAMAIQLLDLGLVT